MLESGNDNVEAALVAATLQISFALRQPRIHAVHVPPLPARQEKQSAFCAVELDGGAIGLAFISLDDTHARLLARNESGGLPRGIRAERVVAQLGAGDAVQRALALATINALTRELFDVSGYRPSFDADALAGIAPDESDHVGMVGFFKPLVRPILERGARLTVLELDPALTCADERYEVTLEPDMLHGCNKALCTSSVLVNRSFAAVRQVFSGASPFVLIGPGAGCVPDPLFERGVTALGGSWVVEPLALVEKLAAGQSWGRHVRKFVLFEKGYPGLRALLARV